MTTRGVLVVDDNPEMAAASVNGNVFGADTTVTLRHPSEVEEDDLLAARLILVDFVLSESWPEPGGCISASPRDGTALIGVYRSHLRLVNDEEPRAFVLLTSQADAVAPRIGLQRTRYAAARFHGFDWMLDQNDDNLSESLASVCDAVYSLDSLQQVDDAVPPEHLLEWLGAPSSSNGEYSLSLLRSLDECHAPVDDIADDTHKMSILRWLMQKVLPYPSMLYGDFELACRLGVDYDSLRKELELNDSIAEFFSSSVYSGPAAALVTRRWWSAQVDIGLLRLSGGKSTGLQGVWDALSTLAPQSLMRTDTRHVPILNPQPDELVINGTAPIHECVRVHPDEWPTFAEDAWARLSDVGPGRPVPLSLVALEDRNRAEGVSDATGC